MSKLADFMAGGNDPKIPHMDLDINAACQICFEYTDEAQYYPVEKILKWKCSQGHVSFIEEFKL